MNKKRLIPADLLPFFKVFSIRIHPAKTGKNIVSSLSETANRNGYVLISSLICLFLSLQLCLLCSLYMASKTRLILAQKQSVLDLSLYANARELAAQNTYARRCGLDSIIELEKEIEIDGIPVTMNDQESCVECTFTKNGQTIQFILYYDDKGVVSSSWKAGGYESEDE